jgi:hypothetical protein
MKIVEFGDDGKPKLLKQAEPAPPRERLAETSGIKVRSFELDTLTASRPAVSATVGSIKIREFGHDGEAQEQRAPSSRPQGPFGAARVPQSIKIVDFDKDKGAAPMKPAAAQERPRGIKIVETE